MHSLSILLPFRNAQSTLEATLESIESQRFEHYELIAINDHSEDDSRNIVSNWRNSRCRLIDNPGKGLVDALNHGIEACTNEWIVRMDADDLMHPNRLLRLWQTINDKPELDLVAHRVRMFSNQPVLAGYRQYLNWQNQILSAEQISNEIYVESPFAHPAVMFKKEVVTTLGKYKRGDFPEDYELWLRMHASGARMLKIPDVLLDWRDSPTRLSRTDASYRRKAFDNLRAQYLSCDPRIKQNPALTIWGAGRITRKRCRLLLDKGFTVSAWIDIDPKKIGNKLHGVPVFDHSWLANQSPKPFVLNYVNNHGAREEIDEILSGYGYLKSENYLSVG